MGGLGFRDFQSFNQALLANQAWKTLHRPQGLLYKVLKAKYFLYGSLLTAEKGAAPSYGWTSLLHGITLLKRGIYVNIGNGTTTQIQDYWIPTIPPRAPLLNDGVNPNLPVSHLIDSTTGQWNISTVPQLVDPIDPANIYTIYTCPGTSDLPLWSHTTDGSYTVKSGYYAALQNENHAPPPLASNPELAKSIWQLQTPPKLHHFLWKLASQALPITDNIASRHLRFHPTCLRCDQELETTEHMMFSCPFSQQLWRSSGLPHTLYENTDITFLDKLRVIIIQFITDVTIELHLRLLPVWIMWRIWKGRNALYYNNQFISFELSLQRAYDDVIEWITVSTRNVTTKQNQVVSSRQQTQIHWQAPPEGWYKCNYDVSHRQGDQHSGMGWIIRNHQGWVLHCGMRLFQGRHTVIEAEATLLIWAIQASWGLNYHRVIYEGDNMVLNQQLNSRTANLRLLPYINTIRQWEQLFQDIRFVKIPRTINTAADALSKHLIIHPHTPFIFDSCPDFIRAVVNNDYPQ